MSLLGEYRSTLKPLEVEEWVDLLIYRPLGFLVAYPLARTTVTPNLVTIFSGIVGVAGAVAVFLGTYQGIFIGAILYMVSNVLDCTDGQLARLKKQFSPYGRIYDGVADFIVGLAMFIAIGLAWKPDGYSFIAWWLLIFFGGIVSTTYQGMHLNHVREAYLNAISFTNRSNEEEHEKEKNSAPRKRKLFLLPFDLLYRLYMYTEGGVRARVRMPKNLRHRSQKTAILDTALIIWTFTGKGTHVSLLSLFLFMGKPEYYMWFTLIPGNIWIFAAWIGHIQALRAMTKHLSKTQNQSWQGFTRKGSAK